MEAAANTQRWTGMDLPPQLMQGNTDQSQRHRHHLCIASIRTTEILRLLSWQQRVNFILQTNPRSLSLSFFLLGLSSPYASGLEWYTGVKSRFVLNQDYQDLF